MSDKFPTYRIEKSGVDYTPTPAGLASKALASLLILATVCVVGTAFSAVLLGLFIRITYWVLNYRM